MLEKFVCNSGCVHSIKVKIYDDKPYFKPDQIDVILGISNIFEVQNIYKIIENYDADEIVKLNGKIYLSLGGICRLACIKPDTKNNNIKFLKWILTTNFLPNIDAKSKTLPLNHIINGTGKQQEMSVIYINNIPCFPIWAIAHALGIYDKNDDRYHHRRDRYLYKIVKNYESDEIYNNDEGCAMDGKVYITREGICRIVQEIPCINDIIVLKWIINNDFIKNTTPFYPTPTKIYTAKNNYIDPKMIPDVMELINIPLNILECIFRYIDLKILCRLFNHKDIIYLKPVQELIVNILLLHSRGIDCKYTIKILIEYCYNKQLDHVIYDDKTYYPNDNAFYQRPLDIDNRSHDPNLRCVCANEDWGDIDDSVDTQPFIKPSNDKPVYYIFKNHDNLNLFDADHDETPLIYLTRPILLYNPYEQHNEHFGSDHMNIELEFHQLIKIEKGFHVFSDVVEAFFLVKSHKFSHDIEIVCHLEEDSCYGIKNEKYGFIDHIDMGLSALEEIEFVHEYRDPDPWDIDNFIRYCKNFDMWIVIPPFFVD